MCGGCFNGSVLSVIGITQQEIVAYLVSEKFAG
jgi:uncharacterized membrane protein YdjX (TVP38/TMEM64 family)